MSIEQLLNKREVLVNLMSSEVCAPYIYEQLSKQLDLINTDIKNLKQ